MTVKAKLRRPPGVKALIPIQLLLSIISIPSGALLLYLPNGEAVGAQTILPYLTQHLPLLRDFTAVGIFLIVVYGLLPIALAFGLWTRKRWAWTLTLLLGVTEILWISAEVIMFYNLGFFFFYPIISGMGVLAVALCLVPSVKHFFSRKPDNQRTKETTLCATSRQRATWVEIIRI
jgi:hypothetical protein